MYCGGRNYGQDMLKGMIVVATIKDGKENWGKAVGAKSAQTINGDWVMFEMPFKYTDPDTDIKLIMKGDDDSKKNIYIDDVMLYQVGTDHYKMENNELFKNNHRIAL